MRNIPKRRCPKCNGNIVYQKMPSTLANKKCIRIFCILCSKTLKEVDIPTPPMTKPKLTEPPHVLQIAGISLYTDTFAYHNNNLYFISCVGTTDDISRVKQTIQHDNSKYSKVAHIVPRAALNYDRELTAFNLAITPLINGKIWQQQTPKIGSNHQHLIIRAHTPIKKIKNYAFPVFAANEQTFSNNLYEQIQRHTDIIAISEWAREIHKMCVDYNWLVPMTTYGNITARMCKPNPIRLQQLIQDALEENQLPLFLDKTNYATKEKRQTA